MLRLAPTTVRTLLYHSPVICVHMKRPLAAPHRQQSTSLEWPTPTGVPCTGSFSTRTSEQQVAAACILQGRSIYVFSAARLPRPTHLPAELAVWSATPFNYNVAAPCAVYDPGIASDGKPYCPDYNLYVPLTVT